MDNEPGQPQEKVMNCSMENAGDGKPASFGGDFGVEGYEVGADGAFSHGSAGGTPKAKTKTAGLGVVGTSLQNASNQRGDKGKSKTRNDLMKERREAMREKFEAKRLSAASLVAESLMGHK